MLVATTLGFALELLEDLVVVDQLASPDGSIRPLHAVQALVSAMAAKGAQPALDLEAGGE